MKIALLTKNKPICKDIYTWCIDNSIDVKYIVAPKEFNNLAITHDEFNEIIKNGNDLDLIVSFLYPKKIKEPIISAARIGCINFHPAPLPAYKGVAPYTKGIIDDVNEWGATAHYIDENIDTGDIIEKMMFGITKSETALSLANKTSNCLYDLFIKVMTTALSNVEFNRTKQSGGLYFSMKDFEELREIKSTDTPGIIERKIRAYWHPPFDGAYFYLNGVQVQTIPSQRRSDECI